MRNDVRGGRRNIRAGQEEAHCRPISYKEREQIWNDAVALETATRKPGCQNGAIGKAALTVLRSLLFDFTNMKTGVCFPRVRTLQAKLQPWYSRAAIFRALDRLEAAGVLVRVPQAHEERKEGGPRCQPLRVRQDHRSRAGNGAEDAAAREGYGARCPARCYGLVNHQGLNLRRFLRRTLFFILERGLIYPWSRRHMNGQALVCKCGSCWRA